MTDPTKGILPGLVVADMRHEWVLTLCLVIAVAAVFAPLLILQGLRHGTVATLRDRLVQDPVYREIRPSQTREYPKEWFERLQASEQVGFLLPTILPASSILSVRQPRTGKSQTLDLVPTAAGDPVILDNGGVIPQEGECVLTAAAAAQLGVGQGAVLDVQATRTRKGLAEQGEARLTVSAVLDPRAGTLPRLYAPLSFVLDVEAYKEGRAVSARGWAGETPRPPLSFDEVLLFLREQPDPVTRTGLAVNTGLATLESLTPGDIAARLGFAVPAGVHAFALGTPNATVGVTSVEALRRKLRGRDAVVLPYAALPDVAVNGQRQRLIGLSLTEEEAGWFDVPVPPWGGFSPDDMDPMRLRQLWLPAAPAVDEASPVTLEAGQPAGLQFPVRMTGSAPGEGGGYMPVELAGVLRTAQLRAVAFDGESFVAAPPGFRGFRLYARTIDDVPALVDRLRDAEVDVIARSDEIRRIQVLDRGLATLFWLIASLGVSGGAAVLVASLYAAVQRKRRDLAILRLVGLTRADVFLFPVYHGLLLAGLGVAVALVAYAILAQLINQAFAADLELGQRICFLPGGVVISSSLLVVALAATSALLGAWEATRIDPAEAIREE